MKESKITKTQMYLIALWVLCVAICASMVTYEALRKPTIVMWPDGNPMPANNRCIYVSNEGLKCELVKGAVSDEESDR